MRDSFIRRVGQVRSRVTKITVIDERKFLNGVSFERACRTLAYNITSFTTCRDRSITLERSDERVLIKDHGVVRPLLINDVLRQDYIEL